MKRLLLALLALPFAATAAVTAPATVLAQPVGGGIYPGGGGGAAALAIGSTPVTGCSTSGYVLFNNAGTLGCEAVSGTGTVTSASVVSANGFAGSVATASTTPVITLSTTVTGLLKGNGTAVSAATSGTDYLAPGGALGTPSSGTLTNATGLPCSGLTGLGTGVCTFLITPTSANLRAVVTDEVGSGALYFVGGALGTPTSATLTNATGLPCSGIASLATGACTFLGTATSANLAALLTDETGTGANVFATGPTLSAPIADRYLVSTSNTNAQSGTTYTVTSSDCGKNVILTNAAAITVSVNTGLTAACWVTFTQGGAGQITVAGSATVNSANGKKTRSQYSVINVMYGGATDTYILSGDSST